PRCSPPIKARVPALVSRALVRPPIAFHPIRLSVLEFHAQGSPPALRPPAGPADRSLPGSEAAPSPSGPPGPAGRLGPASRRPSSQSVSRRRYFSGNSPVYRSQEGIGYRTPPCCV